MFPGPRVSPSKRLPLPRLSVHVGGRCPPGEGTTASLSWLLVKFELSRLAESAVIPALLLTHPWAAWRFGSTAQDKAGYQDSGENKPTLLISGFTPPACEPRG